VDGDTSTNDSAILAATGAAGAQLIDSLESEDGQRLYSALLRVHQKLAQALIRDGEGATKFVTLQINSGLRESECLKVGYAIAESPLVKTAIFASDPNWGRIVAAIGNAGIPALDVTHVQIYIDAVRIVCDGRRDPDYREEQGAAVFAQSEFTIRVELGRGQASEVIWTCDFSYDYVRINADYRS
jgi:glutamate N-acetyltransferase/amino-acid N-acetyltransferase